MAKFDFKKLVNDSADKLKNGAQKAQEAVKEFDIKTAAGDVMTKGKTRRNTSNRKPMKRFRQFPRPSEKKRRFVGLSPPRVPSS